MKASEKFKGSFPALVTPLNHQEEVDEKALRKLVKRVLDAGANGILVLGTAGEGPILERKEKYRVIEIAADEVNGRVPILAGTGDISTKAVKENNKKAAQLGASGVLVVPPFYFNQQQDAVIDFYKDLAQEGTIPVLIYNFPQVTKIYAEPETIGILSKEEGIVGVKDSSANFVKYQKVLGYQSDDFVAFQGIAALLCASLLLGANGTISPVPNVAPEIEVNMYKAIEKGDIKKAIEIQTKISKIAGLWAYGGPTSTVMKAILNMQGICDYVPVKPNPTLNEEGLKALREKLVQLDVI